MQHNATHNLHIELALSRVPPNCFPNGCEGLGQQIVKGLTLKQPLPELLSQPFEFVVREPLRVRLKFVDLINPRLERPGSSLGVVADKSF
jgi:hypothetical protein